VGDMYPHMREKSNNILFKPQKKFCHVVAKMFATPTRWSYPVATIPGSGMKFRVGLGMGMGTAEDTGISDFRLIF
jgi:hypothetical protein